MSIDFIPWLLKPFGTSFALEAILCESHYIFIQIQHKRFIASLGMILIAIASAFYGM